MASKVSLKWQSGMAFEGLIDGHSISIDASPEQGGANSGPRPKALMLLAFAGCTGMDVVSLLVKMRETIDDFDMEVEADLSEDHPKIYTRFQIIYYLRGDSLSPDKVKKAVTMSQEKYCGVAAMFRMIAPLSYKIILNGKEVL